MVLIDDIRLYRNGPRGWLYWCHMASDDPSFEGMEELHTLAESIGLRREWFQNHPRHPHYDLPPDKRELAIAAGAAPVSSRELVRQCSIKEV
ncbi:MAG: DUF4031 domain-containing protein [Chloroflexota bacterium]